MFFFWLFFVFASCKQDTHFIPKRHNDLNKEWYAFFVRKLNNAYRDNDDYNIAFQLSNLKYKGKLTEYYLKRAVEKDSKACMFIYETVMDARHHGFYKNIFKNDTTVFLNAFKLCLNKLGSKSYEKYVDGFIERSNLSNYSCSAMVDTSVLDIKLNSFLTRLLENDQKYRKLSTNLSLSQDQQKNCNKQILETDSLNLQKLDSLFVKHGFPDFKTIKPKQHKTVFLILHHQSDNHTRLKYRPIIEKYYPKNLLDLYDKYTFNGSNKLN